MRPIKYIVENEKDALWGLSVNTVGVEIFNPGEKYPSKNHKDGYYFDPLKGRKLYEYQLCYIPEGSGFFESASCPRCRINGGVMFLLFPNEWHTYFPDIKIGWKQYWIGFSGVNIDVRVLHGFLKKESPIFNVGLNNEIINLYQQAINVAIEESAYFQLMLAGITNHLLGLMYCLDKNRLFKKENVWIEKINCAKAIMQECLEESLSIHIIAEKVGMSYSMFRKCFKKYSNISPSQYLQNIRLQRAKELLRMTDIPVKEISYRLHFETPDYFSAQFKKKIGVSPSKFRE